MHMIITIFTNSSLHFCLSAFQFKAPPVSWSSRHLATSQLQPHDQNQIIQMKLTTKEKKEKKITPISWNVVF